MKHVVWILVAAGSMLGTAFAQDRNTLLRDNNCYVCHADSEDKTGPAFAQIAAVYRGRPDAVASLAKVIREGKHGPGPWHMPPHPEVPAANAAAMAKYILSLKK
jgi:sulfite dehydrogenase